jgi:arylsulfatase
VYIDDKAVATKEIRTQLGVFSACGEGFMVGLCVGSHTRLRRNPPPWAFAVGTLLMLVVDVSGEAYKDLELEALAMMKRE